MSDVIVTNDAMGGRLVVRTDDDEAELVYDRDATHLYLLHTEVPDAFRGQGTGARLVTAALDLARQNGLVVVPWCPFARGWLREHPAATEGVSIDWKTPPSTE